MCVCVCMRECVRVHACVCACVCAGSMLPSNKSWVGQWEGTAIYYLLAANHPLTMHLVLRVGTT